MLQKKIFSNNSTLDTNFKEKNYNKDLLVNYNINHKPKIQNKNNSMNLIEINKINPKENTIKNKRKKNKFYYANKSSDNKRYILDNKLSSLKYIKPLNLSINKYLEINNTQSNNQTDIIKLNNYYNYNIIKNEEKKDNNSQGISSNYYTKNNNNYLSQQAKCLRITRDKYSLNNSINNKVVKKTNEKILYNNKYSIGKKLNNNNSSTKKFLKFFEILENKLYEYKKVFIKKIINHYKQNIFSKNKNKTINYNKYINIKKNSNNKNNKIKKNINKIILIII